MLNSFIPVVRGIDRINKTFFIMKVDVFETPSPGQYFFWGVHATYTGKHANNAANFKD
jgi:hypothetical protein